MDVNCCEKANNYVKEEEEEEDIETLKKRIKGHALFRLLIERHLDCLKVRLYIYISYLSPFFLI